MTVIFDILRKVDSEARACDGDGSAHQQWLEARDIDQIEVAALIGMMGTGQLAPAQAIQVAYEAGYKAASDGLMP